MSVRITPVSTVLGSLALLLASHLAVAEMRQTAYLEGDRPEVRVSVPTAIAGLSMRPLSGSSSGSTFWAKLPEGFSGVLTLEVTTHDHTFYATATFSGAARGGWERVTIDPVRSDRQTPRLPGFSMSQDTIALRAWIAEASDPNTRRLVLVRWGGEQAPGHEGEERLRVQLNVGNATEAAVWLESASRERLAATCGPLSGRTHVSFRWVCDFGADVRADDARLRNAKLILARRERDGREQFETTAPAW